MDDAGARRPSPDDASARRRHRPADARQASSPATVATAPEVPTPADTAAISRLIDEIMPLLMPASGPDGWASSRSDGRAGMSASGAR